MATQEATSFRGLFKVVSVGVPLLQRVLHKKKKISYVLPWKPVRLALACTRTLVVFTRMLVVVPVC